MLSNCIALAVGGVIYYCMKEYENFSPIDNLIALGFVYLIIYYCDIHDMTASFSFLSFINSFRENCKISPRG